MRTKSYRAALYALGAVATLTLIGASALNPSDMDPTCKPCDDFARYATGGWEKTHPIPAGHASWGIADEISESNRTILRGILEDAAKNTAAAAGSDTQKLGAFYRSCMDEAGIERAGTTPVDAKLATIRAVHDVPSLVASIAQLHRDGVDGGIGLRSSADAKNSDNTTASLGLGGLGMPDRDYYLKDDERTTAIRNAYRTYVATQLTNLGDDSATAQAEADNVVALETAIARITPARVTLRDPNSTYHPTAVADLSTLAPHIPWTTYFTSYGAPAFTTLNVSVPAYVTAFDGELTTTPVATWKAYLRYKVADAFAASLPKRFGDASFAFRSGVMTGVKEQLPRWQRCTTATDGSLRDILGKAYVAKTFSPAAKARALALVNNVQSVLRADIATLDWMSPQTKTAATVKLDAFTKKIGYPDRWDDFSALRVSDGPYAANVTAVREFESARTLARIGHTTDRGIWGMTPPTFNAYYNPSNNEVAFPAGILQPPFFDPNVDDAVNYGAIGAAIGHEMTHGFDDQGRRYDARGNLRDWWTADDATRFNARAQCIVDEYDALEPVPGVHDNGKLVQGEAIADLGGLTIAYRAFERTPEFQAHAKIDGYTPEQRFFLAYAESWRSERTEQQMRQQAVTDPHPDEHLRVNGIVSNMPEFEAAFACAADAPMVRKTSCQVW